MPSLELSFSLSLRLGKGKARLLISSLSICSLTLIPFQTAGPVLAGDFKDHGLWIGNEDSKSSLLYVLSSWWLQV